MFLLPNDYDCSWKNAAAALNHIWPAIFHDFHEVFEASHKVGPC